MTGFARTTGQVSATVWAWEIRSVNGKGLDVRLRLPSGFDNLEGDIRKAASSRFSRGNLQVSLALTTPSSGPVPRLNQAALESAIGAIKVVEDSIPTSPSSAAEILSMRGVMELAEPEIDEAERKLLDDALLAGAEGAMVDLTTHRAQEGAALGAILLKHLQTLEGLLQQADADPANNIETIKTALCEQIDKLVGDTAALDADRLHQEAALLATKADIREELDRLKAHVAAGRELISKGSPAGRKLEFLAQELNREANTLCSKSNGVSLTEIGLEMKVVIDQFREQILNVE